MLSFPFYKNKPNTGALNSSYSRIALAVPRRQTGELVLPVSRLCWRGEKALKGGRRLPAVPQGSSANNGRSGCSLLLTDSVVPSGPAACEGSGSSSPPPLPDFSSPFYGRWGRSLLPYSVLKRKGAACVVGISKKGGGARNVGPTLQGCSALGEAVPEGHVPGDDRGGAGSANL